MVVMPVMHKRWMIMSIGPCTRNVSDDFKNTPKRFCNSPHDIFVRVRSEISRRAIHVLRSLLCSIVYSLINVTGVPRPVRSSHCVPDYVTKSFRELWVGGKGMRQVVNKTRNITDERGRFGIVCRIARCCSTSWLARKMAWRRGLESQCRRLSRRGLRGNAFYN